MSRRVAVGNLLQAGAYCGAALWLWPQWRPAAILLGGAALLQVTNAALELVRRDQARRGIAAVTLLLVLAVLGLFAQAAVYTIIAYGPEAADQGRSVLFGLLAALPWTCVFPVWQWRHKAPKDAQSATRADPGRDLLILTIAAGVGGLPAVARGLTTRPIQDNARLSPQDATALTRALWAAWTQGQSVPSTLPASDLLLTPWSAGHPGQRIAVSLEDRPGAEAAAALQAAIAQLPRATARPALVVDLVTERWPAGTPASPAHATTVAGPSPVTRVHSGQGVPHRSILPGWRLPIVGSTTEVLHVDSYLATPSGVTALINGWAPAPSLDADTALAAAVAAGDMLLAHQGVDGRYAYVVEGPSGRRSGGYNFPRHAGATWFLARLASRTGQSRFATGADSGLAYLVAHSRHGKNGRAWVMDPRRDDGRAWIGTTALAALAAVQRQHPMTAAWAATLVQSVDARGAVRGELDSNSGDFPDQPLNPYGQGQTTLALAALVRSGAQLGHDDALKQALDRASAFLSGPYAPGAAGRLFVLDEHWICLAQSAIHDISGATPGMPICRAYLAQSAWQTPTPTDPLAIAAGPAGGLAEAVVAAALLHPDPTLRRRALAFGQHFLDNQYRPGDSPLLPQPAALLGGFRDRPWDLDVRVDAVQHIGCALLGIEALLRGQDAPGSRP